jgi:WhiB family redox-sensing transcriptional regulator
VSQGMDWAEQGACLGTNTNDWYSPDGSGPGTVQMRNVALLKRICSGCPVQAECLEWAIKHESHGFWAGTLPSDRKMIRRKRGIVIDDPMYWGASA